MAVGDAVGKIVSLTPTSTYDIKPDAGVQWVLHNLKFDGAVEFYDTDGINALKWDSDTTFGATLNGAFHLTNTFWLQLKNIDTVDILISYDGIQTK